MVWCALAYSLGGSLLAWRVGRPLVALNAERYAREADLRFALVRVNEHADGIALYGGEADERRLLDEPVERVVTIMARLAGALARLTWITSGYGWLALVVPIVVAAPGYFDGELSFGALMMVVGAFNQVQSSLRWFVDNLAQIADWRATLLRIVSFRDALPEVDTIGEEAGRIAIVEAGGRPARARGPGRRAARGPAPRSTRPGSRWGRASASRCSASPARARARCSGRLRACGPGAPGRSSCRRARRRCSCRSGPICRSARCAPR